MEVVSSNQINQPKQPIKLPLYAYCGVVFLALVYLFSMISFALDGDGLLIKVTSFSTIIATISIVPALIGYRKVASTDTENKSIASIIPLMFLSVYMGFSYVAVGPFLDRFYVYPVVKTSTSLVANNIQINNGLFADIYRIETDSGVYYIKDDLVVTGKEFNLQTRETKDGLLTKTYICVADECSGIQ